ncbi:PREDICTED: uncharacterized protein LOC104818811 [Tarenaya hassleriana]|uniref:uncharacterized protein LOC104818811 n=1 Tax=Tarenaya hassleriana TaxID=28532 RepID=UPI00053C57E1|nr:PREDICTED: uncharacterized protein LOC104818811 [Tarenaya hassleriana]
MARGQKLTMSRSERYLGSYSYGDGHPNSVTDQSELVEDDIWSATAEHEHEDEGAWTPRSSANDVWSIVERAEAPSPVETYGAWPARAAAARDGLSLAFQDSSSSSTIVHPPRRNGYEGGVGGGGSGGGGRQLATSAPVNVPDWSKIYRVNSVESIHESEDEEDSGMVPPHEYQVRRSRKIGGGGGASLFQGVGRTLKGRELRRVRDAIWSQTGFYG